MAAEQRGQRPLIVDLSTPQSASTPPISALFLIYFDIKAGYTIGWKRSLPSVELEGVVEYKSLPSGLHTVKEDLIYFVHEDHAGLSAFVNAPAAEEARNARMIAVGVLVPLSYGRLGRAWKHAEALKEMASELIIDMNDTKVLEEFWEEHKAEGPVPTLDSDSIPDSPSSFKFKPIRSTPGKPKHGRSRSASDGTSLLPPGHNLSAYHPAWSLPNLLETFGPLIFPLHRAALLRKRILITGHAPVEEICNFVYDLSILSNIPLAVTDLLSATSPPQRLRPLFTIGVHDIPLLEADLLASQRRPSTPTSTPPRDDPGTGWIACTTDSILAMKSKLYDVLVTLPPPHSKDAIEKQWPTVEGPDHVPIKATQRDLRRWKALRWGLSRQSVPSPALTYNNLRRTSTSNLPSSNTDDEEPNPSSSGILPPLKPTPLDLPDTDPIIEPLSWSALAYSGFMWWASAGEQRASTAEEEETDSDAILLSGLSISSSASSIPVPKSTSSLSLSSKTTGGGKRTEGEAAQEMAIIAYFHRLTSQILTTLSDIIDSSDSDDEREAEAHHIQQRRHQPLLNSPRQEEEDEDIGPKVYVTSADVARMGLDVWSASDLAYIEDIARTWYGRRAEVEGRTLDVCGVRIC